MRCLACNRALTDYEATRKSVTTNEFIDLCNGCFSSVSEDLQTLEREDLLTEEGTYEIDDSFLDNYKDL
jgi:hypothetical protein